MRCSLHCLVDMHSDVKVKFCLFVCLFVCLFDQFHLPVCACILWGVCVCVCLCVIVSVCLCVGVLVCASGD